MQGEIGRLDVNNPNYILELGVGPPVPNLVPQQPGSGAVLAGEQRPTSNWAPGMTPHQLPLMHLLPHAQYVRHQFFLLPPSAPGISLLRVIARPVLAPAGALHLQEGARLRRRLQVRG
jgi:hypothetical protein